MVIYNLMTVLHKYIKFMIKYAYARTKKVMTEGNRRDGVCEGKKLMMYFCVKKVVFPSS